MNGGEYRQGRSGAEEHGRSADTLPPIRVEAAGVLVDLHFGPGLELLSREIAHLWRHLIVPARSGEPALRRSYRQGQVGGGAGDVPVPEGPEGSYVVSGDVTRQLIDHLAGNSLLLHAGAVDVDRIGVVLLLGPSGAGKSTATARLGRRGRYLTDELTVLDPRAFTVSGYPKPISLIAPLGAGPKRDLPLPEAGLEPALRAEAPTHVVLVDRIRPNADRAAGEEGLFRVPLARALPAVVEQTSALWRVPGGLVTLARLVERCGGLLVARYREAEVLSDLLADPPPAVAEHWERVVPPAACRPPGLGEFAVTPFLDALLLDDSALILSAGRLLSVSSVAALVWQLLAVRGPMGFSEIRSSVVEALGHHPCADVILDGALRELVRVEAAESGGGVAWVDELRVSSAGPA